MNRWNDLDRTFALIDAFRRRADRQFADRPFADRGLFDDGLAFEPEPTYAGDFPQMFVRDKGTEFVLTAELPGVPDADLKLTVDGRSVTLEGARKADVPKGYTAHRRERAAAQFSRTVSLPVKIDAERATAVSRDGMLTVTLPKMPEAQPRQITVRAQA